MRRVHHISAITLKVGNMERSCQFYSKIPGFRIVYGGAPRDTFSTFELGKEGEGKTYLNLELRTETTGGTSAASSASEPDSNGKRQRYCNSDADSNDRQNHDYDYDDNGNLSERAFLRTGSEQEGKHGGGRSDFGRIIFHTEDVDGLYRHMKEDGFFSRHAIFETEPADAPWGERFFHIREPDGYQLSFAQPLKH